MCISKLIRTSLLLANQEGTVPKRSQTHPIRVAPGSFPTSARSLMNDQASCIGDSSRGTTTPAGIMGNLATFCCLHQQSGTDALLFYQQNGLKALAL